MVALVPTANSPILLRICREPQRLAIQSRAKAKKTSKLPFVSPAEAERERDEPNLLSRGAKFVPRPCVHPRFIAHLPKPGLFVRTSCGSSSSSSSSARSRTASRAAVDDLRAVAATEADSLYYLLGISECGTTSEIRQAYRQLVLKYHPDVSPPNRAKEYTKRFIQVQETYETLSDPISRALYDRDMAIGGRKPFCYIQVRHGTAGWKLQWESQINELQRRSTEKDLRHESMSWGARIRRQR